MAIGESDKKDFHNARKKLANSLFLEIFDGKGKDVSTWLRLSLLITNNREAASAAIAIVTPGRLKKLKAATSDSNVDIGVHASEVLYALRKECRLAHDRELDMHIMETKPQALKSAQQPDTRDSDGCSSIVRVMANRQFAIVEAKKKEAPAAWRMLHEMVCESIEETARDVLEIMTPARVMLLRQSSIPSRPGQHGVSYFERGYATNILQELERACLAVYRTRLEHYVDGKTPVITGAEAIRSGNQAKVFSFPQPE